MNLKTDEHTALSNLLSMKVIRNFHPGEAPSLDLLQPYSITGCGWWPPLPPPQNIFSTWLPECQWFLSSISSLAKHSWLLYYSLLMSLTSQFRSSPGFGSLPSMLTPWGILLVLEPYISWMTPQMCFPRLLSFLTSTIIYLTISSHCHLHVQ